MARYRINNEKKRIDIIFEERPSKSILDQMNQSAFSYHATGQYWYCFKSDENLDFAKEIVKKANGKKGTTTKEESGTPRKTTNVAYSVSIPKKPIPIKRECQLSIEDLVVYKKGSISCESGHKLESVVVIVNVLNRQGRTSSVRIDAYYCSQCDVYYIYETDYFEARKKGIFFCGVLDERSYKTEGRGDFSSLSGESILKRFGYATGMSSDLSDAQRRAILDLLLTKRLISVKEMLMKLQFFINMHKNRNEDYGQAVDEWSRDRDYVKQKYGSSYSC